MQRYTFSKGHATMNDFVIIDDQHGAQDLAPELVAHLCNRRSGIGGDGLLRVVRAQHIDGWDGDPDMWFMDYRNGDGSVAEMCGNGLRLFARHLMDEQLVNGGTFQVGTRAGTKEVQLIRGGLIATNLGRVALGDHVTVLHDGDSYPARAADVGNPHAVTVVDRETLPRLDLHRAPSWQPAEAFPDGVNVEFVSEVAPGELAMRVFERGSGETMSCGTGVVAAAAVHRDRSGFSDPISVAVPGGDLLVDFAGEEAWLSGPAVVTMRGEFWG